MKDIATDWRFAQPLISIVAEYIVKDEVEKRKREVIESIEKKFTVERIGELTKDVESRLKEMLNLRRKVEFERGEIIKEIINEVKEGLEKWEKGEVPEKKGLADFIVMLSQIPKQIGSEEITKATDGIMQKVSKLTKATLPIGEKMKKLRIPTLLTKEKMKELEKAHVEIGRTAKIIEKSPIFTAYRTLEEISKSKGIVKKKPKGSQ